MAQQYGSWTIKERDYKYHNSFINVREDQVLQPDGQPGRYATVLMKPGVAILPINSKRIVYLSRQFRYAVGQESIEVVCGSLEEDEPPLEAAKREIEEELGIKAGEWVELGLFHLDTSIVHCPVYLFLAKELTFTQANQEGTEAIERLRMSFDEAVQMVMDSEIAHGPSCVLILKAYYTLTQS